MIEIGSKPAISRVCFPSSSGLYSALIAISISRRSVVALDPAPTDESRQLHAHGTPFQTSETPSACRPTEVFSDIRPPLLADSGPVAGLLREGILLVCLRSGSTVRMEI